MGQLGLFFEELEEVFRCVKCGKCLPVCPIYELSPDEYSGARGKCLILQFILSEKINFSEKARDILSKCVYCLRCQAPCQPGINFASIIPLFRFLSNYSGDMVKFSISADVFKNAKDREPVLFVRKGEFEIVKNLEFLKDFEIVFYEGFFRNIFLDLPLNLNLIFKTIFTYLGRKIFFVDSLEGFLCKNFFYNYFFEGESASILKKDIGFLENIVRWEILAPYFLKSELEGRENVFYFYPFELAPKNFKELLKEKFKLPSCRVFSFYPPFQELLK